MFVIIAVGLLSAVAGALWAASHEQKKQRELSTNAASNIAQDVQNRLRLIEGYVYALTGYFAAERELRAREFYEFAEKLNIIPAVRSLQFVRFVSQSDLDEYLQSQRRIHGTSYVIREKLSDASTRPSQARLTHWPVELVYPVAGNEAAIGLDIMTNPTAKDAIERSQQTGRIAATDSFILVQDKSESAFLIYDIVARPASDIAAGAVAALVNVDLLVSSASGSTVKIVGIDDALSGSPLLSPKYDAVDLAMESRQIVVGDRNWILSIGVERQGSPVTAGIFAFGLVTLLTLLAVGGLNLANLQQTNKRFGQTLSLREQLLHGSEAAYSALFYNSVTANAEIERETGKLLRSNSAFEEMTGYSPDEFSTMTIFQFFEPSEHMQIGPFLSNIAKGQQKSLQFECRLLNKGKTPRWVLANIGGDYAEGSDRPRIALVMHDITARKKVEEARDLLVRELAHRLRNTMQLVSSLVEQTGRSAKSADQFKDRLLGRLRALTTAQDVLFETNWAPVRLDVLAKRVLEPFQGEAGIRRIEIDVAPVTLSAQESQTISLALHELASNAARHGALGGVGGKVSLNLSLTNGANREDAQTLNLTWIEAGAGVRYSVPETHGFGSIMLKKLLARQHGGEAHFDWQDDKMIFHARLPLREHVN